MTTRTPSSGWLSRLAQGSLVKQILIGLVLGVLLALVSKPAAIAVGLLGTLFVGALKAVAPVLVLMLVMASIANHQHGQKTSIRPILFLYLLGTFSAALLSVLCVCINCNILNKGMLEVLTENQYFDLLSLYNLQENYELIDLGKKCS